MLAFSSQRVLILSFLLIMMKAATADVCDNCNCFPYEEDTLVISCKNYKNHQVQIDFEAIEWPKNEENYRVKAFFNKFPINLLPKITGDANVISMNLDSNGIRTITSNPFEYFRDLEEISVANNRITELTKDFLKSQTKLKQLNLSNNSLSTLDPMIVAHLKDLQEINLSHNFLTKITADFLEATSNVEVLRLENNKIYAIDNAFDKIHYNLRKLFLAHNQFTVITSMFEKLTSLEIIDLSDNKISNVDENAFSRLMALKLLDMSNNNLKRVSMRMPDSLELLSINNNKLSSWPLVGHIPENLTDLELHNNNLDFIFPNDPSVPNLVKLDVASNLIHQMPDTQFIKLEHLNLGYNLLKSIPQNINSKAPFLKELILDGNEISSIEFVEPTTLGSISLCNLTTLHKIEAFALSNLSGTQITFDHSETCVSVRISQNEHLVEIERDAFHGVRFCELDLSYNGLKTIPRNLTDWKNIDNGFNLQGNPLLCECDQEWMLIDIMKTLYDNIDYQHLLLDLRCAEPEAYKSKRLVQFLNHEHPFCSDFEIDEEIHESGFGRFLPNLLSTSDSSHTEKKIDFRLTPWTPGFLIIVIMCSVILVLIIIVGVKWQKDQNLKLARRNRLYYDDY